MHPLDGDCSPALRVNCGSRRYCGEIGFCGACAGAYGDPRPAISVRKGPTRQNPGTLSTPQLLTTKQAPHQTLHFYPPPHPHPQVTTSVYYTAVRRSIIPGRYCNSTALQRIQVPPEGLTTQTPTSQPSSTLSRRSSPLHTHSTTTDSPPPNYELGDCHDLHFVLTRLSLTAGSKLSIAATGQTGSYARCRIPTSRMHGIGPSLYLSPDTKESRHHGSKSHHRVRFPALL